MGLEKTVLNDAYLNIGEQHYGEGIPFERRARKRIRKACNEG